MSLQEFDALIDRMKLKLLNMLIISVSIMQQAKVLYQMNEQLPDDLQLSLDELENPESAKSFVMRYQSEVKLAISEYRQRLMNFFILFLDTEISIL